MFRTRLDHRMSEWMRNALTLPIPRVSWSSQHSLVCFYTYVLPDPSGKDRESYFWPMNVRGMPFDWILLNSSPMTSSTPAFWSWWHPEECFQTRWRRRRWLQMFPSTRGWLLCWGCHLMKAHRWKWSGDTRWEEKKQNNKALMFSRWPLYQFFREVIT